MKQWKGNGKDLVSCEGRGKDKESGAITAVKTTRLTLDKPDGQSM